MLVQSQHFVLLGFEITVAMHFQLYTLIPYIFVVESLQKRWFHACTSLQQGTCVLYCGPISQVNCSVGAKSGGR